MTGSMYMDKCYGSGDLYTTVPVALPTTDPSCDGAARYIRVKRVPTRDVGSYDPYCEVVTSYGKTVVDGKEIGWMRIDHEGSYFDPNTTETKAVCLTDASPEITIYDHVWPRIWNDPLGSSMTRKEVSLDRAAKLRAEIAKMCTSTHKRKR